MIAVAALLFFAFTLLLLAVTLYLLLSLLAFTFNFFATLFAFALRLFLFLPALTLGFFPALALSSFASVFAVIGALVPPAAVAIASGVFVVVPHVSI